MPANSFFSKKKTVCPACDAEFSKEVMRTGQGRLASLLLREDLRRVYKFSKKYGVIYPLIYSVVVCPECLFASLSEDFDNKDLFVAEEIRNKETMQNRMKQAEQFLPDLKANFTKPRDLAHGLLSYYLAAACYNHTKARGYGSGKKAITLLRGAWCASDLFTEEQSVGFDRISIEFRFRAMQSYDQALQLAYKIKSKFNEIQHFGPDLDTNYGYNGFIYVHSYLTYYFLDLTADPVIRYRKLVDLQNGLSKVFGFGKSSKNKPSPLLDTARDFYEKTKSASTTLKNNPKVLAALEKNGGQLPPLTKLIGEKKADRVEELPPAQN